MWWLFVLDRIPTVGHARASQNENLFDTVTFLINQTKNFASTLVWPHLHGRSGNWFTAHLNLLSFSKMKIVGTATLSTILVQFCGKPVFIKMMWWWRCLSLRIAFFVSKEKTQPPHRRREMWAAGEANAITLCLHVHRVYLNGDSRVNKR